MLGEVNRGMEYLLHTNMRKSIQTRMHLNLDLNPLKNGDSPATNSRIFSTDGLFRLRYCPSSQKKNKGKPFVLRLEFYNNYIVHLNGWEDYEKLAKEDERVQFIRNYIDLREEHFDLAKANIGMDFYFTFDVIKYIKDVAKKAGTEPDLSILRTPEINEIEKLRFKTFLEKNSIHDVEV